MAKITKSDASVAIDPVSHVARAAGEVAQANAQVAKAVGGVLEAKENVRLAKVEAISEAITAAFTTVQKAFDYLATRDEWRGRVDIARAGVDTARVEFEKVLGDQKNREQELDQFGEVRRVLVKAINQILDDLDKGGLSHAERGDLRRNLVDIGATLASVGKK